jgi:hypothetical protein
MKMEVTPIILCHPLVSHPSSGLVLKTINSLSNIKGATFPKVIVAHDLPQSRISKKTKDKFWLYVNRLPMDLEKLPTKVKYEIIFNSRHGHLIGNIKNALQGVETKYILLVQQDMPFIKEINLDKYLSLMEQRSDIRHIRFNKVRNMKRGWDAGNHERADFFRQVETNPKLLQTLAWSDENHLTTKEYYQNVVFPIVGKLKTFPESILNQLASIENHSLLGTYVAGEFGDEPNIKHMDGSLSDVPTFGFVSKLKKMKRRFQWSIYYRYGKFKLKKLLRRR